MNPRGGNSEAWECCYKAFNPGNLSQGNNLSERKKKKLCQHDACCFIICNTLKELDFARRRAGREGSRALGLSGTVQWRLESNGAWAWRASSRREVGGRGGGDGSTRDEEVRRGCGVQGGEESSVRGGFQGSLTCPQAETGESLE